MKFSIDGFPPGADDVQFVFQDESRENIGAWSSVGVSESASVAGTYLIDAEPPDNAVRFGFQVASDTYYRAFKDIETDNGGYTDEDRERDDDTYDEASYIANRLRSSVPGDGPADFTYPDPATPGMVNVGVALRDGRTMITGAEISAQMIEGGSVNVDGAYEVDKKYLSKPVEGQPGVYVIELFESAKLKALGYKGLYKFEGPGLRRTAWILDGGGTLQTMPLTEPET